MIKFTASVLSLPLSIYYLVWSIGKVSENPSQWIIYCWLVSAILSTGLSIHVIRKNWLWKTNG